MLPVCGRSAAAVDHSPVETGAGKHDVGDDVDAVQRPRGQRLDVAFERLDCLTWETGHDVGVHAHPREPGFRTRRKLAAVLDPLRPADCLANRAVQRLNAVGNSIDPRTRVSLETTGR